MIKHIFASAASSLKECFESSRFFMVLVMMAMIVWVNITPLYSLCNEIGYRINPLLFSFIVDDPINQLILMLAAVLLFADAPFTNANQVLVLERSGRLAWVIGKLLFMVVMSAVYWFLTNIVLVVLLIPVSTLSTDGWGAVVNTLAQTNAGEQFGIGFSIDPYIIQLLPPIQATLAATGIEILSTVVLAGLIMLVNLVTSSKVGLGVSIFWVLLDLLIVNVLPYNFFLVSVASHGRLELFGIRESYMPTLVQCLNFDLIACIVLIALSTIVFCRKDITVQEDM